MDYLVKNLAILSNSITIPPGSISFQVKEFYKFGLSILKIVHLHSNQPKLDVSGLKPGYYFINIKTSEGISKSLQ